MSSYPDVVTWCRSTGEVFVRGTLIGHIGRRSRVAAGTGARHDRGSVAAGTRKMFWTAAPLQDKGFAWRPGDGASIGTRFATPHDAYRALALFDREFRTASQGSWPAYDLSAWRAERKRRWGF